MQAAAGGDHHGSSTQFLEEQVSIVGVDAVVVVEVGGVLMLDVGTHAGDIVQQSLTVIGIDLTVAVKVTNLSVYRSGKQRIRRPRST